MLDQIKAWATQQIPVVLDGKLPAEIRRNGAAGLCEDVSVELASLAAQAGFDASYEWLDLEWKFGITDPSISKATMEYPTPHHRYRQHCVLVIRTDTSKVVVDLTGKQYDRTIPVPYVIEVQA